MILRRLHALIETRRKANFAKALGKRASPLHVNSSQSVSSASQVLVISHDAFLAGAQSLLLNLLANWKRQQRFPVKVVCVESGVLRGQFEELFPTLVLSDYESTTTRNAALLEFIDAPIRAIYSSTVVNGPLLENLRWLCAPVITHCHEMQTSIDRWASGSIMAATLTNSDFILGASDSIARNLRTRYQVPAERLRVVYASIDFWDASQSPSDQELARIRTELDIATDDIVVFGCGTTDWRKGPDLFLETALLACQQNLRLKFIWIGGENSPGQYQKAIAANGLANRIRFIGDRSQARRYFYTGNIFALTSREDPCALVALEAANAKLPVVCFEAAGDIPKVLGPECGAVVRFEDFRAFADAVLQLSMNAELRSVAGNAGCQRVRANHNTKYSAAAIEQVIADVEQLPRKVLGRLPDSPLVTVIIPNYNHCRFLEERLTSVAHQSLRNIEIIVLDDASTDNSRSVLEAFVAKDSRARLSCNEVNSGSTFKQWSKGLAAAQGKYIWIAESDDAAHRTFLAKAISKLESDSSVIVAHTQSMMIDADGRKIGKPDGWLNDLAPGRWNNDFVVNGTVEIGDYLSQKNTIPNASAVVFRNFPGIEHLVDDTMRLCADWLFWIRLLARGKYTFVAKDLNLWRQSSSNARTATPGVLEWAEGQRVLSEVAEVMNFSPSKRTQMLESFRTRCVEWSGGLIK